MSLLQRICCQQTLEESRNHLQEETNQRRWYQPEPKWRQQYFIQGENENQEKFIAIEDNGPGISNNLIDQIFIPFFTTKDSGTGIGLSLSRRIVQLHGGNLKVSSTPSEQTSFLITF